MRINARRLSRLTTWLATGVAVVGSGVFVLGASYSSFTSTTSNGQNSWTSGSVHLTDDDGGSSVLFNVAAVKPGATDANCIAVTSDGNLPSTVRLYGTGATTDLAPYVTLAIEVGTGGGFNSCSGFTPAASVWSGTLSTLPSTWATGADARWTTGSTAATKVYRITYTLSAATPDTAQGKQATTTLTWEAQNS